VFVPVAQTTNYKVAEVADYSTSHYQNRLNNLVIRRERAREEGDASAVHRINTQIVDYTKHVLITTNPNQAQVYEKYMASKDSYATEGAEIYKASQESTQNFDPLDASDDFYAEKGTLLGLAYEQKRASSEGDTTQADQIESEIKKKLRAMDLGDPDVAYLYYNWNTIQEEETPSLPTPTGQQSNPVPQKPAAATSDFSDRIWGRLEDGDSKEDIWASLSGTGVSQEEFDFYSTSYDTTSEYADAVYKAIANSVDPSIIHHSKEMYALEAKMRLSKDPAVQGVYAQIEQIQEQSKQQHDQQMKYESIYQDKWDALLNGRRYGLQSSDMPVSTPEEQEVYEMAGWVYRSSNDLSALYWKRENGEIPQEEIDAYLAKKKRDLPRAYSLLESSLTDIQSHVSTEYAKAKAHKRHESTWDRIRKTFNFLPLGAIANALFDVGTHKVGWKGFLMQLADTVGTGNHFEGVASRAKSAFENSASYQHGDVPIGGLLSAGFSVMGTLEWNTGGDAVDSAFEASGVNAAIKNVADDLESQGKHKLAQAFRYSMDAVTNPLQLMMTLGYYSFVIVGDKSALDGRSDGYTRFLNDMGFEKLEDTANRDVNVGDNINSLITVFMMEGLKSKGAAVSKGKFAEDFRVYKKAISKGMKPMDYLKFQEYIKNPVEFRKRFGGSYEELSEIPRETPPPKPKGIDVNAMRRKWQKRVAEDFGADNNKANHSLFINQEAEVFENEEVNENHERTNGYNMVEMPRNSPLYGREAIAHDFTTLSYETEESGFRRTHAPEGYEYMPEPMSNLKRAVWKKGNLLEIAYRGTDPLNRADVRSDLNLSRGQQDIDPRFIHEREWFQENVVDKGLSANIQGHSLGGSVTLDINRKYGGRHIKNATTFNAGHGYMSGEIARSRGDYDIHSDYAKRTVNIVHRGDAISTGSHVGRAYSAFRTGSVPRGVLQVPYGETRVYNNIDSRNPIAYHKLDTYTRAPGDEWVGKRIKEEKALRREGDPSTTTKTLRKIRENAKKVPKPRFEFGDYGDKDHIEGVSPVFIPYHGDRHPHYNQYDRNEVFGGYDGYDDYDDYGGYEDEMGYDPYSHVPVQNPPLQAPQDDDESPCPPGFYLDKFTNRCTPLQNQVFI
jgi:hypothetical protein